MISTISPHWHLLWIAAALLAMAYIGSPRQQGTIAFREIKRLLQQSLNRRRYTQFHDIELPAGGGSEHIDHLVVSRNGIFVIVSEYRPGVIKGGESQEFWQQRRYGRKRWPNPVHRAKNQMENLERLLELPRSRFHVLVAISGQKKHLEGLPPQVLLASEIPRYIHSRSDPLLSPEQVDAVTGKIRKLQLPRKRRGAFARLVRLALGIALLLGIYLVYGETIKSFLSDFENRIERMAAPERFDDSGERKSQQEILEESLVCAFSEDSGRCSCYRKGGEKIEVGMDKCREIAERGSILKQ